MGNLKDHNLEDLILDTILLSTTKILDTKKILYEFFQTFSKTSIH